MIDQPSADRPLPTGVEQLLTDILMELRIIRFCVVPDDRTHFTRSSQADEFTIRSALNDAVPALERAAELNARREKARANNWQPEVPSNLESLGRAEIDDMKKRLVAEIGRGAS
jgi:hypothetical protein